MSGPDDESMGGAPEEGASAEESRVPEGLTEADLAGVADGAAPPVGASAGSPPASSA